MISQRHRFIFLHIPKTGGNAVQSALLPFSDETKTVRAAQDGVQQFGLKSRLTPRKHATLAEYAAALGLRLKHFRVTVTLRHPFDRAVSFYFSPHRWRSADAPVFHEAAFFATLSEITPMWDFLALDDRLVLPDTALRFDTLQSDFAHLCRMLRLPEPHPRLEMLNTSAAAHDHIAKVLQSSDLRQAVETAFEKDMKLINTLRQNGRFPVS